MSTLICTQVWPKQLEKKVLKKLLTGFETLAKAEKSHAGKFQKTLESIS